MDAVRWIKWLTRDIFRTGNRRTLTFEWEKVLESLKFQEHGKYNNFTQI